MTEFRADLHCHSTFSDGTFNPEQILTLAKKNGLSGISITDHDTISAYATAIPLAKKLDIHLITGVEFSTRCATASIHILGYSIDIKNEQIDLLCEKHQRRREERNRTVLEKLAKLNMPITEEDVIAELLSETANEQHSVGRPHIAQAMVRKGYVQTVKEAFQRYLGDNKSCYVADEGISTQETIDTIHNAGGFAIIAHPHLIDDNKILKMLLKMNFDGIEAYYGNFNLDQNKRWIDIATQKNWLITGGSDFHGDIKPTVTLGSSWVEEETFRKLQRL